MTVTANNPSPKEVVDAAVFGFVFDEDSTSVVANNPDGASDAGQVNSHWLCCVVAVVAFVISVVVETLLLFPLLMLWPMAFFHEKNVVAPFHRKTG